MYVYVLQWHRYGIKGVVFCVSFINFLYFSPQWTTPAIPSLYPTNSSTRREGKNSELSPLTSSATWRSPAIASFRTVSLEVACHSPSHWTSEEETKFCLQFFERFLGYVSSQKTTLDPNFYLKVLFPVMTSYLKQHRTYFMPSEGQRGHSFASREEKLSIIV